MRTATDIRTILGGPPCRGSETGSPWSADPTVLELDDGTAVRLRPLRPDDVTVLNGWFEGLSRESRYRRFFSPKPFLTDLDRHRLLDVDGGCRFSLVALVDDGTGTESPVALAGWVSGAESADEAEIAVAVIDDLQGHGLGSALLRHLGCRAVRRGIETFSGEVLWENRGMRRLLLRLAESTRVTGRDLGTLQLRLPTAEMASGVDCGP